MYDPNRQPVPSMPKNSLEVDLVFNVRPCGTCQFFWPQDESQQPYGPYTSYDFNSITPDLREASTVSPNQSFVWIDGTSRPPSFPDAEVMDGCRKAPIMTVGINPNLTAFGPGPVGASWCYPSFSGTDAIEGWGKYAYYYRYRSLYQEHLDLSVVSKYFLPEGRIIALKAGQMADSIRSDDSPAYDIRVHYDGDPGPTAIHLPGKQGESVYVTPVAVGARFQKGDILAARLAFPAGKRVEVFGQAISYYLQMVPVLKEFETFLKKKGNQDAQLRVGDDVGQIDMVACASPHWGPQWLGGSHQAVNTIVSNCVHKNGWALKQLVQTQPAIVFLVGQSSWNMFRQVLGHLIQSPKPLPTLPEDGPYTLLRMTSQGDYRLRFATKIGRTRFSLSTRIVITPHFSYNDNFLPQFRMMPTAFNVFSSQHPKVASFFQKDSRIRFKNQRGTFVSAGILKDHAKVLSRLKTIDPSAQTALKTSFYDPHAMMAGILKQMYPNELNYVPPKGRERGFLARTKGPCQFCDNSHWRFPQGCPYGKPNETQYKVGFLEEVASAMLKNSGV